MITDIFILICLVPITIITTFIVGLASLFPNPYPVVLTNSFIQVFGYLGYLRGIFPIDTLFQCLGILALFYIMFYSLKVGLWLFAHVPYFGKHITLPALRDDRSSVTTRTSIKKGNTYYSKSKTHKE